MIRFLCREVDLENAYNVSNAPPSVTYITFTDAVKLESWLRWYEHANHGPVRPDRECIGIELVKEDEL